MSTDSTYGEDDGVDIDHERDVSTAEVAKVFAKRWRILVVSLFSIAAAWYVYTARGSTVIAAMLAGGGLFALWWNYRDAEREARTE